MLFNDNDLQSLYNANPNVVHEFTCVHSQISFRIDNEDCLISAIDAPCALGALKVLRDNQYLTVNALDLKLAMHFKNHKLTICFL